MRRVPLTVITVAGMLAVLVGSALPARAGTGSDYPVPYNFLTDAVTAGANMNADAPGSNDWHCTPTKRHPRPVVLVHGTLGNKNDNWQTYAPLLANHGYCVFALTYGVVASTPPGLDQFGGMDDMKVSAKELAAFVRKVLSATGAHQVDIIGHSQGTVVPEYYVKFLGGAPYVKNYISLAPLWKGTKIADPYAMAASVFGVPEDSMPVCTACAQFGTGSRFMKHLRQGGLVVGRIHYTNIVTDHDELVVPYTSGIARGMTNVVLQDLCPTDYSDHFEIAATPTATVVVLNTLDPRHPQPVPCQVVLPFEGPLPLP